MKYDIILTDIDNTLFDFNADSAQALQTTFRHFGCEYNEENKNLYFAINASLWEDFEKGKIEKKEIYPTRFRRYLDAQGMEADPVKMNAFYMKHLALGRNYLPDSRKLLKALKAMGCEIYGATNGSTDVQTSRMGASGMRPLFDGMYISEQMGVQKPHREFYDMIFAEIGEDKRGRAIMLGDSLTSDMQGGRNAGIATCFYGDPEKADERCDYVITELMQFVDIIK